jgi:hypothetical protein
MTSYIPADDFLVYPIYINTPSVLLLTPGGSTHLDPCIYTYPFEAIPHISVPMYSQGHQPYKDIDFIYTVSSVTTLVTSVGTAHEQDKFVQQIMAHQETPLWCWKWQQWNMKSLRKIL